MPTADVHVVTEALGVAPIYSCAGDFGWVTRPRLWWLSVDWEAHPCDPETGLALSWGERQKTRRLRLDGERRAASDFDTGGLSFPEGVSSGRLRVPCATTPAADDAGRSAPRSARGRTAPDVQARWLADSRRFAP